MTRRALLASASCLLIFAASAVVLPACAGKKPPLEAFAERQKERVHEGSAYIQADFDFWAALYEPSTEDLEALRNAWVQHGEAFPESKALGEIEREVNKKNQKVVLVALFMTSYENADLKEKSLGWSVHPVPSKITELSETDVVLRTLMPVKNPWARYFLLRYSPEIWVQLSEMVVSNSTSRLNLKRWKYSPAL